MKDVTSSYKKFIKSSLREGRDPQKVLEQVVAAGFPYDTCIGLFAKKLKKQKVKYDTAYYQSLGSPNLLRGGLDVEVLEGKKAQVYSIDNFFPDEDCRRVIELSKKRLVNSIAVGDNATKAIRTSMTCVLAACDPLNAVVIDKKISDALGIDSIGSEKIQVQRYEVNQYYKIHSDYFYPGSQGYKDALCNKLGQRSWTFMIYLNDVEEGGETEFPALNLKVKPKMGKALIWNNLHMNGLPNKKTHHIAHPVIAGEKSIITKWFRDKPDPSS